MPSSSPGSSLKACCNISPPCSLSSSGTPSALANRSQNTHRSSFEVKVLLYPWHLWHGQNVLTRKASGIHADLAYLCVLADASPDARLAEIPRWMFDAATCTAVRLERTPSVDCAALRGLRGLLSLQRRSLSEEMVQRQSSECATNGDADGNNHEPEKSAAVGAVLRTKRRASVAGPRRLDTRRGSAATSATARTGTRSRPKRKPKKPRRRP
jgi:hypothetical protein